MKQWGVRLQTPVNSMHFQHLGKEPMGNPNLETRLLGVGSFSFDTHWEQSRPYSESTFRVLSFSNEGLVRRVREYVSCAFAASRRD